MTPASARVAPRRTHVRNVTSLTLPLERDGAASRGRHIAEREYQTIFPAAQRCYIRLRTISASGLPRCNCCGQPARCYELPSVA
jgi:hypothetical protein